MGGLHIYRATATCDACGFTMDVGPFEDVSVAIGRELEGWLLTDGMAGWVLSDRVGYRFTLCPACMDGPLWEAMRNIERRNRPKT